MTRRLFDYIVLLVVAPLVLAAASGRILILLHDYYLTTSEDTEMEKPLPELPSARGRKLSSNLALTTEARAHLHRFVSRALEEEKDMRDRDTWAEKVEASLDELGASLTRGGWLPGLKRGRYVRRRHHEEEEKRKAEEQAKRDKEQEEQARNRTAKGRSKLKESVVEDNHILEDEPNDEQRDALLEQLRDAASRPFLPTPKPSIKHLLLTVAGPPTAEPAEDMGFRLVRSAVHCSFKQGEYVLPKTVATADSTDATVLYGLDDWDGEFFTNHPMHFGLCIVPRCVCVAPPARPLIHSYAVTQIVRSSLARLSSIPGRTRAGIGLSRYIGSRAWSYVR